MKRLKSLAATVAAKVGMGVLTERVLTVLTRVLVDIPMVYLFLEGFNFIGVASVFIVWYFIFCLAVIYIYDYCADKGHDLLGINYIVGLKDQEIKRNEIFKRFARWIVKRRITIFLVGSLFELDPDIVTLLLRKKGERGFKVLFYSVAYSIITWSVIYWLGVKGYGYFRYFVE
jgi:hypothetical protein